MDDAMDVDGGWDEDPPEVDRSSGNDAGDAMEVDAEVVREAPLHALRRAWPRRERRSRGRLAWPGTWPGMWPGTRSETGAGSRSALSAPFAPNPRTLAAMAPQISAPSREPPRAAEAAVLSGPRELTVVPDTNALVSRGDKSLSVLLDRFGSNHRTDRDPARVRLAVPRRVVQELDGLKSARRGHRERHRRRRRRREPGGCFGARREPRAGRATGRAAPRRRRACRHLLGVAGSTGRGTPRRLGWSARPRVFVHERLRRARRRRGDSVLLPDETRTRRARGVHNRRRQRRGLRHVARPRDARRARARVPPGARGRRTLTRCTRRSSQARRNRQRRRRSPRDAERDERRGGVSAPSSSEKKKKKRLSRSRFPFRPKPFGRVRARRRRSRKRLEGVGAADHDHDRRPRRRRDTSRGRIASRRKHARAPRARVLRGAGRGSPGGGGGDASPMSETCGPRACATTSTHRTASTSRSARTTPSRRCAGTSRPRGAGVCENVPKTHTRKEAPGTPRTRAREEARAPAPAGGTTSPRQLGAPVERAAEIAETSGNAGGVSRRAQAEVRAAAAAAARAARRWTRYVARGRGATDGAATDVAYTS